MYIERLDINCRPKNGENKSKVMAFVTNKNFTIIPVLQIRDSDERHAIDWRFQWLFFFVRYLSSPDFSLEFAINSFNFAFVFSIFYFRFGIWIPFPHKFQVWMLRFNRDVIQQSKNGIN